MGEQILGAPAPPMSVMIPAVGDNSPGLSFVANEIYAVQGQLAFLYELIRELTPEKKFNEAQLAVQKRAEEEARKNSAATVDPRVDELVNQVNSLTVQLPKLIAAAVAEVVPRNIVQLQREPDSGEEDLDFGEPTQPEDTKNARRRR